jgi:hypothetical protein
VGDRHKGGEEDMREREINVEEKQCEWAGHTEHRQKDSGVDKKTLSETTTRQQHD